MPLELERISGARLQQLPRRQTVFFFPVGPVEDHGPHLPMGLDLMEARRLCELAAERLERELPGWTGVLMPSAPLGVDSNTTAAALTVRAHVLRDWLLDSCRGLKRMGFAHFVCFSGHLGPRQLTAIEEAGRMLQKGFRRDATLVSACSALVSPRDVRHSPLWPDPAEHGGARDASVGAAVGYANLSEPVRERSLPESYWRRFQLRRSRQLSGHWGNPAEGTAERGAVLLSGTIEELFPKLRAVWEGSNPNHLFRSWYSVLPPNRAFFKVWLLAFVLLGILWLWALFTMQDLLK